MYRATIERAELKDLLKLTTDNSAIYAALTGANGVSEIGFHSGYSAQPGYRLIRVDHRLHKGSVDQFEIALVNDAEASLAFYATPLRSPAVKPVISATPSLSWTKSAFLQTNVVARANAVNGCWPTRATTPKHYGATAINIECSPSSRCAQ